MKPFLAVIGGFVVALGMFAGGAVLSFMVLKAEPDRALAAGEDTNVVWTSKPRKVDVAAQDFERVEGVAPVKPVAQVAADADQTPAMDEGAVDTMTTAAVQPEREDDAAAAELEEHKAQLIVAHVDWCYDRYRSYDADTNTYRPYSGGHRDCVSPYLEQLAYLDRSGAIPAGVSPAGVAQEQVAEAGHAIRQTDAGYGNVSFASGQTRQLTIEHVNDCMSRYRSYRVEDNSYQPYGGGPRRQCK